MTERTGDAKLTADLAELAQHVRRVSEDNMLPDLLVLDTLRRGIERHDVREDWIEAVASAWTDEREARR